MLSSRSIDQEMYQDDEKYFIEFQKMITDELNEMMENDGKEDSKRESNKKIMVVFPKCDRNLIDKSISFELTFKEIPSRSIILGNIPEGTTEDDIKYLLNKFGDYESCNFNQFHKGRIVVKFCNLKDAMMMRASSICINFRSIIMSFGNEDPVIDKKHPPNNGTIVVFNLPESATDYDIRKQFEQFGDIRDIRKTPNKNTQRFVEFYDTRSAMNAKGAMKKKKLFISGRCCQINVEYSLPGNYRVNHEKYYNHTVPTIQRRVSTKAN